MSEDTATTAGPGTFRRRVEDTLFAPVELGPLVFFRVFFGAVMLWEVVRYFKYGWIESYYIQPDFFFTYPGFDWVRPWRGLWMYVHFMALGILALLIALGLWFRLCAALFFLGFTYVFLLDQSNYLNHFYLISLLSLTLIFLPAHRAGSLDALRRPALHAAAAPVWGLWLLRLQIGIAYFYGGLAKLNADWLRGEPMRDWLAWRIDFPLIGRWFDDWWATWVFSYGGLLFDLLIVPALLWRPTRRVAFALAVLFHVTNAYLFQIGIFPWFMIGATMLFFDAERFAGVRRLLERLLTPSLPATGAAAITPARDRVGTLGLLALYAGLQLFVPLRHFAYPGNVSWTEEGHNFSWHMKLRTKGGDFVMVVQDKATGEMWTVDESWYLTPRQQRKMISRPDMIVMFAHYVEERMRAEGRDVGIRVFANLSLNNRPRQLLIDPSVDLTQVPRRRIGRYILPLEPLAPRSGTAGR